VAEHRDRIGGEWTETRRTAIPLDPLVATRVSTAVDAGGCLDVLVVPAPEVSHLDATIQTLDGRVAGRLAAAGRTRTLVVCSETTTPLTLAVRPQSGRGLAALVLARARDGLAAGVDDVLRVNVTPTADLAEVSGRVAEQLERQGYQDARRAASGTLVFGRRESVGLDLPQGCARLEVLVGNPARGVQAWLWSSDGDLVAEARGGENASLFACGAKQRARLDLDAVTTGGPYAVELRDEPRASEVLAQHPLAASRLVQHLVSRGVLQRAGQVGAARAVQLDPAHLVTHDFVVPVGRCVEVGVGLGPESVGVEIHLVDRDSNEQIELERGTIAAAARACSLDRGRTLNVRAEIRATNATTSALLATRMLAPQR
jgi:hypothetical protein